jgi:AcrR family transcriptional regulator
VTELTGRRERKKQLTRQAISDVATSLFMEKGFDAVTVAEVAAAADVAVQTVFNHFPAKEDLFFDQSGWWTGPARAIRDAPEGMNVVEALRQHYLAEIRERVASAHLASWAQFSRTIEGSPALLARRRRYAEEMEELIVAALQERDEDLSLLMARFIAAQYAAAQKVLEGQFARFVVGECSPAQLEQAIEDVFEILARGLGFTPLTG